MSYETALETLMEQSQGRILVRTTEGNKRNNSRCAANNAENKCESDKRDQLRDANFTSNANNNSIRAAIIPATSPIDRTGVLSTPRDATNSELEREGLATPSRATEGAFGSDCLDSRSSNFQSGFSGLTELSRDLPPDNSEPMYLYCSKYIAPFSFCLMAKIPTVLIADLDNQQSTEGKRYEHPGSMDTWSEHERVH